MPTKPVTGEQINAHFARWARKTYGFDFRQPYGYCYTFRKGYARNTQNIRSVCLISAKNGVVKAILYGDRKQLKVLKRIEMPVEELLKY